MILQPKALLSEPPREEEMHTGPRVEPPRDQDALMIAAALRASCPVTSGGSTILVAPESTVPVAKTVRRLSRALERLTGEPVLVVEFGFDPKRDAAGGQSPVSDICTAGGELRADRLLASNGENSAPLIARFNGSPSDLLPLVASGRFPGFLAELKTRFRFVILEGRSLRDSPESVVLAQACDGAVITVEYARTPLRAVVAAQKVALRAGIRILGFVLDKPNVRAAGS